MLKIFFLTFIIFQLDTIYARALAEESSSETHKYFGNYLSFEFTKNQPVSKTQKSFKTGDNTFFVGFRHTLKNNWLMGVHGGYKQLLYKNSDKELNIFSVQQESLYLIRVNHPLYVAIGPKIYYLLPTIGRRIPPEREKEFNREVGAAASISLHYIMSGRFIFSLRVDRWRGVNSNRFHGTETAIGINYRIPSY